MTYYKHSSVDEIFEKYGQTATAKETFYDWFGGNEWLFFRINHLRGGDYDTLMQIVTKLGDYHFFPYYLLILAGAAALWGVLRKIRGRQDTRQYVHGWAAVFLVLIVGFFLNHGVIHALKNYFQMPRPYVALAPATPLTPVPEGREVHVLEKRGGESAYKSFPSGHMAFITLMVVGLWPMLRERGRTLGWIAMALVAWSRVSLGVHFPADVLWAFVVTSLLVILLRMFLYRLLYKIGIIC